MAARHRLYARPAATGLHALDGARYLRDAQSADPCCAAAAVTSQPVRSSRAALRKASHAMASASATSVDRNRERDDHRHPDIVGAPAELGRDLSRGACRVSRSSEGVLEVRADHSPGTPAAPARHGEPHRVAPLHLAAVPLGTLS